MVQRPTPETKQGVAMIRLYSSAGSTDLEILEPAMDVAEWVTLRERIGTLILVRGNKPLAELFNAFPFQLSWGTNRSNDEFLVLHAELSIERYTAFGEADAIRRAACVEIADTLAQFGVPVDFIVITPESPASIQDVDSATPVITSAIVERALRDAQQLIQTSGPISAIDRVHTALHGYLRAHCHQAGVGFPVNASATELWKLLRSQQPRLSAGYVRGRDIQKILRAVSSIVDALGSIRNRASVAHPNEALLDEPEAMLFINAVRTLLHYLDAKTGSPLADPRHTQPSSDR